MFSAVRGGVLVLLTLTASASSALLMGQGMGGIHSIRGSIYLPNGRLLDKTIKVELQSTIHPTQTDFTDANGAFSFPSIFPGPYTVVVDAGEMFEIAREQVLIDKEIQGRSVRIAPVPKHFKLPIHLRAKPAEVLRNEVLNVKWAAIPKEATRHFKKGYQLMEAGNEGEAETEFRNAVAIAPNFAPAHTAIGNIELKAGRINAAVDSFKKAIRYDAADFDANVHLGIALVNLGNYSEAEPALVTAAYLNRTAITPHYYLGIIFFVKRDLDIARKAFETAKGLKDPKSMPQLHRYLGQVYEAKKMNKEAVAEFETYLSIAPTAKDADGVRRAITEIKARPNSN